MKVKDLINELLNCDMNKEVAIEYPNNIGRSENTNYSLYKQCTKPFVYESISQVILGTENED